MVLPRFASAFLLAVLTPLAALATIDPALQMQLGNPSNATADSTNHNHYLIQRAQYALDYSDTNGEPNWVSWDLTSGDVGGSGRSPTFYPDTSLPSDYYEVTTDDYDGVGAINFNRGHMCPSEDRTDNTSDNLEVFLMDNIVPQSADNNQGPWEVFEDYCRTLASAGNEILITSGPSQFTGTSIPSGKAAIPGTVWKIAVVVPLGSGTALSRINAGTRVIALEMPNINGIRNNAWQQYITSVNTIQQHTGFTFFTSLDPTVASVLRAEVDGGSANGSPTITTQPAPQSSTVGGTATFSVGAASSSALSYQWYDDNGAIAGATDAILTLTNLSASDIANYYVVVSNSSGAVVSNLASLAISGVAPFITTQPQPVTVSAGVKALFSAAANGSAALSYQWQKNGANLSDSSTVSGSLTANLSLLNPQAVDIGNYALVVTNGVGSAVTNAVALTVNASAPVITAQPAQQSTIVNGTATFSVTAIGSAPMTYTWRFNGNALSDGPGISGSSTASLVLTSVALTAAGNYDCVVTNSMGSVAATAAALLVNPDPITNHLVWTFGAGTVLATPSSGLPGDGSITGGTVTANNQNGTVATPINTSSASNTYTGFSASENIGAAARTGGLVTTSGGSAYFEFTLTPGSGRQLQVSSFQFGSRSTSTGPATYALYTVINGTTTAIASAGMGTNSVWTLYSVALPSSGITAPVGTPITFRIFGYNGTGNAAASTENWRIDDLSLVVAAPLPVTVTSTTPAASANGVAQNAAISFTFNQPVDVTGNWYTVTSTNRGPVAVTLSGGPTTFTLTPNAPLSTSDAITVSLAGSNIVDESTGATSLASNYTFSFTTVGLIPPTITADPTAASVSAGANASFSVAASGTAPLTYHWQKNGVYLSDGGSVTGSGTPALSITGAQATDAANYACVVSNPAGTVTSASVALTVILPPSPPAISAQPTSASIVAGNTASFTVSGSGNPAPTYQWYNASGAMTDAGDFSGTATSTLMVTNAALSDAGSFSCVLTNPQGTATSQTVTLVVTPAPVAPTITSQPASQAAIAGQTVIFSVAATGNPVPTYQWRKAGTALSDGGNVSGSTSPALVLTSVSSADVAAYTVLVTNGVLPNVTSSAANLSVFPAGSIYWDFSSATPIGLPADQSITGGTVTQGNNNGTTALLSNASVSSGYTNASGGNNAEAACKIGAFSAAASTYFQFTLAPSAGQLTLSAISFGMRSTSTGPQGWAIYSSNDGYTNPLFTGAISNSGTWTPESLPNFTVSSPPGQPIALRIYGFNGTGNAGSGTANWRIDDLKLTAAVAPASAAVSLGNVSQTYDGTAKTLTATAASASFPSFPPGSTFTYTYNGVPLAFSPVGGTLGAYAPAVGQTLYVTTTGSNSGPVYGSGPYGVTSDIGSAAVAAGLLNVGQQAVVAVQILANQLFAFQGIATSGYTLGPVDPGSYAVTATLIDPNYTGTASGTLTIAAAAIVQHAPVLSGSATITGSLQMLGSENVSLGTSVTLAGDLLVPGTPALHQSGSSLVAGIEYGTGSASPSNTSVTLSGSAVIRYLLEQIDPSPLPVVTAGPSGGSSVLANPGTGNVTLAAGNYGAATVNGVTLVLGTAGATTPSVYTFSSLNVTAGGHISVVGPVSIVVSAKAALSGSIGTSGHPEWTTFSIASGGITLSGTSTLYGTVIAPSGTVLINSGCAIYGGVEAATLQMSGTALLQETTTVNP